MRKAPEIPRDVFFGGVAGAEETPARTQRAIRPAVNDAEKVQVTVYLSETTAKRLEALRFHLLNEHNVKVSKSAIADYAISQLGEDLTQLAQFFAMGER